VKESKAYIETGILELYVLGQLNVREQKEVEQMAADFPEIREEINAIEIAMEMYAISHAIEPTLGLEKQIFEEISKLSSKSNSDQDFKKESNSNHISSGSINSGQTETAKIIPLKQDHSVSTIRSLRFALVACIGLLMMSVVALYGAHDKLSEANAQIASLNNQRERFAATVSYMKDENKDLQEIASISGDPTWTSVKLAGTAISPQAKMMVYWHKSGQHVMVDNTRMSLPQNDASHQYQLWAIVNGKPVDLGVFNADAQPKKLLVAMKEVAAAQAFAVTLEKRGGSTAPTMEKMVVQGVVSI